MSKKKNDLDEREKFLSSSETEFVIMNSPDDYLTAKNGDEESLVKIDNPDDLETESRK